MDFVSAIWGEKYVEAGSGLIRSFATHCPNHHLIVYTDVPETLPGPEESRNVSYHLSRQEDWLNLWVPYWHTGGRQMITKLSLLDHRMSLNGDMPVMWVDADVLFLDNPEQDFKSIRSFKLVVDQHNHVSSALWGVGSHFQLYRLYRWADERVEAQDEFGPVIEQPMLQRWWDDRRDNDAHNLVSSMRLYDAWCGEQISTAGLGTRRLYWKNGGIFSGQARVVTLRFSPAQINEHQSTKWRAFENDQLRNKLAGFYKNA